MHLAAGEREAHRLRFLGRELVLALTRVDLLAVQPGGVAVGDRREHDSIVVGVE